MIAELGPVALVGSGDEVCAVARLAARGRCTVRLHDPDAAALKVARERIRLTLMEDLAQGLLAPGERQHVLDSIQPTRDLATAVTHAEFVLVPSLKPLSHYRPLWRQLGELCRASTIVAAGSAPYELLEEFPHPGRLLAMRVPVANRATAPVEIVITRETPEHVLERACLLSHRLGRVPRIHGRPATEART